MTSRLTCLIAAVLFMVASVHCYSTYRDAIPNGNNVPHPCKANLVWNGVGHRNMLGGGARNPFGTAFAAAQHTWTADLCNADSDNDGLTNGEELGDPNCTWTAGSSNSHAGPYPQRVGSRCLGDTPAISANLSHPGVCEPTDSAHCLNENGWEIDCSEGADFTCTGVGEPDTLNVTLEFDRTLVPSVETTYICQKFDIPGDREYHLIATKPIIDNINVMHHTLLYACEEGIGDTYGTPTLCGMSNQKCERMIGGWTLGSNGGCHHHEQGVLVGKGHATTVLMEHHWNNPTQETSYYDSSGMTLFLTPNLRPNNVGTLVTGQSYLAIPPGRERHTEQSTCPSSCSARKISDPIYISNAHLHMHYLGSYGRLEHWRNGEKLATLLDEDVYDYDTPVSNVFDPAIEFLPGDEIKTVCGYNSMSKTQITSYGEATSDEMCFGFFDYYPAERKFDTCVSYKEMDECEISDWWESQGDDETNSATLVASSLLHVSLISCILSLIW